MALIVLLAGIFLSGNSYASGAGILQLPFKNISLKSQFSTEEGLFDNLNLDSSISPWGSLDIQNSTSAMGVIAHKYKNLQTQIGYSGNFFKSDKMISANSLRLKEDLKLGRHSKISMEGTQSLVKGTIISDDRTFIKYNRTDLASSMNLNFIPRIKSATNLNVTYQVDNSSGDKYLGQNYSQSLSYFMNPSLGILVSINNQLGKNVSVIPGGDTEFSLLVANFGFTLKRFLRVITGDIQTGVVLSQKGKEYLGNDMSGNFEGNLSFNFRKFKNSLKGYYTVKSSFGTDRVHGFSDTTTDGTESLVYKSNPVVPVYGTNISTAWDYTNFLSLSSNLFWESRKFHIGKRSDNIIGLAPSLKFGITRFNILDVYYSFKKNFSNKSEFSYSFNNFGIKLTAKIASRNQ